MRNTFRNNDGFTLVELLVTILTGSLIMLAAVSILLLGVRINVQSMGTANRQTTTRILMSSLEDLAAEGNIAKVESNLDFWKVFADEAGNDVLYTYNAASQTVSTGETVILEGVISSDVELNGKLLTVTVTTEDGTYTSSVYCRRQEVKNGTDQVTDNEVQDMVTTPGADVTLDDKELRYQFLQKLASQYAIEESGLSIRNPGLILNAGVSTGKYYSQWYATDMGKGTWGKNGWGPSTPWCACYISWGLNQVLGNDAPCYANVDNFMNYLKKSGEWKYAEECKGENEPKPGDLIFFDWKINNIRDPEHIGAVVKVDDNYVYTIEGNSSNRVAIRRYRIDDPRILGYGVLVWENYAK